MAPITSDLERRLGTASTLWDAARALTEMWRDSRPEEPARLAGALPYTRWCRARDHVVRHFRKPRGGLAHLLTDDDRRELLTAVARFNTPDGVEAAAWGLGAAAGALFAAGWAEELRRDGRWPHATLQDGELIPADPGPWPVADRMAHPDALNTPAAGQVPSVRAFAATRDGARWEVTVSFEHQDELLEVLQPLRAVHGLHPNESDAELRFGHLEDGRAFGVTPPDDQTERMLALCHEAWAGGARVTILPELAASAESVAAIADALNAEARGGRLAVCGSYHHVEDGARVNLAVAHLLDNPNAIEHRKLVPFAADVSSRPATAEGIDVPRVRSLTVHQAGRFRLALLICKDLLTDSVADQTAALGVNTLLVPSMSRTTGPFDANIGRVVNRSQGLVAVVNGPQIWDGKDAGTPAKLGRPTNRKPIVAAKGGPPRGRISRLALGPRPK